MSKTLPAGRAVRGEGAAEAQERAIVRLLSLMVGMVALGYYATHGEILLYGDAVAHLHIARRVFDSLNPGFRQLGSVWLPLPHLLLIPFVLKLNWWRNGVPGSVPAVVSYMAGCVGIYRLAREWLPIATAAIAVLFYGLNPNLLYLSSTAMTEPLYLAEMIWIVVLLFEIKRGLESEDAGRLLSRRFLQLGMLCVCAVFTRYDGWVYAALAWLIATGLFLPLKRMRNPEGGAWLVFTVMVAAAPALWIAYNAKQFHDPLDFLRGPYSAQAIELRTATPGAPHYPGFHSMRVAAMYFAKASELDAVWPHAGTLLLLLAAGGSIFAVLRFRHAVVTLLLWLPLAFYAYSVAYGSVPIFIPVWWPFSFYNTRYGMELLPVFALSVSFAVEALTRVSPRASRFVPMFFMLMVALNCVVLSRAKPLVLREAIANGRSRIAFEHALAQKLADIPPYDRILMYTSAHVGALQQAGIALKRTINEGDDWRWRAALESPSAAAPWVIAIEGDAVADAIKKHPENLEVLSVTCGSDQGCARIYRSRVSFSKMTGGQD